MKTVTEQKEAGSTNSNALQEAIRLAQQGDGAAFEFLYRLHSARVYALCLRMVGISSEAQDLTQEVFLQVFRKIHTFRGESAFSTWLHRLTSNLVLMHFRRKKLVSTPLENASAADQEDSVVTHEFPVPDLRLAGTLDRIDIQMALNQLPKGYKSVFILHDVQGYQHNEIASLLGLSIGASKSQLHKARKRLRTFLSRMRQGAEPAQQRAGKVFASVVGHVNYEPVKAA